jgi:hypothetical protein
MNRGSRLICLYLLGCWLAVLLCSCSGYTPHGRVATRDEALTFFNENRKEFDLLRDMLFSEEASRLTVYSEGNYRVYDKGGKPPSQDHIREYIAKLDKLGLPSVGKGFIDQKYPMANFNVSAVGLVGNGPSVTIFFTKGRPALCYGTPYKIDAHGWYIASSE